MKLNKLALCITSALAITACGGGGSGSSDNSTSSSDSSGTSSTPSVSTAKVKQEVKVSTFSSKKSANVLSTLISSQATEADRNDDSVAVFDTIDVCLDLNNNNQCDEGEYTQTLKNAIDGTVTLEWPETVQVGNSNILAVATDAEGKTMKLMAKASDANTNSSVRPTLYLNQLTNLARLIGIDRAAEITGLDKSNFSSIADIDYSNLNAKLAYLAEVLSMLTTSDGNNNAVIESFPSNELDTLVQNILTSINNSIGDSAPITTIDQNGYNIIINIYINVIGGNIVPPSNNINHAPVASFTFDIDDGKVTFNNTSSDEDNDNLVYTWKFGDSSTSNAVNPVHTYGASGKYVVNLIATDGLAASQYRQEITIDISNPNITIDPDFTYAIKEGTREVFFTNTTPVKHDVVYKYEWNFGDNETSTIENPVHTYKADGTYKVNLKVTANGSVVAHKINYVSVKQGEATIILSADFENTADANGRVTFKATPSYNGDSTLTYLWNFGDGNQSEEHVSNSTIAHDYAQKGSYKVKLTVKDQKNGISATYAKTVFVGNDIIVKPSLSYQINSNNDGKVSFTANQDYNGSAKLSYLWNFGDNTTSTEKNPSHQFAKSGSYTVTLTVTDANGVTGKDQKTVTVAVSGNNPVASFTSNISGATATFSSKISNVSLDDAVYVWNFGDGNTSSEANPTHTYSANGSYNVSLIVKDKSTGKTSSAYTSQVSIAGISTVCTSSNPYCLGDVEPAECSNGGSSGEICTTEIVHECSNVKVSGGDQNLTSINTEYYATNPNGQYGKNKTISMTNASDWTTDMIIAQGAANDDPRAFRGYHEKATDLYALYAAWDDTNLYLMVEMPNLKNVEKCGDFDYSCDQFLPMGIALRTGKRTLGNGELINKGITEGVWTAKPFYNIAEGVDTILMFHPRLPTVNTPGLFKTDSNGKFSYDAESGALIGFDKAGIKHAVLDGNISKNLWGIPDNYGKDDKAYLNSSEYKDLLKENEKASARLYQIAIPLNSLDITKNDIETNGIGAMVFSTFGESMMDALPWTPNLVDVASEEYSADSSSSHEKEDFDEYNVPLAAIGNAKAGIVGGSGELVEVCKDVEKKVCKPATSTVLECPTTPIEMTVEHNESQSAKAIISKVTVATGYKGVTYTWKVDGKTVGTTNYAETTKEIQIAKGSSARTAKIEVTASSASGNRTVTKEFSVSVPACEDCSINSNWAELGGIDSGNIKIFGGTGDCKAPEGAIILKAESSSTPNLYLYQNSTYYTGKWPGAAMNKLNGCTSTYYTYTPNAPVSSASAIFNAVNGNERFPGENKPGADFSSATPCFDWDSKTFLSTEACGMSPAIPTDQAYVLKGGKEVANGSTITIVQKEGEADAYVELSLMVYGETTDKNSTGTFTIDGVSSEFVNGQIIRVGEKITAQDKAFATPVELTVEFNGNKSTYKIVKVNYEAPTAETQFTWNNANVYFVMTDRFYNGDKSNDNSYGRPYKDATGHATATFHGGDIKGMTEKLDYIKSLGINAIWITAPYEQSHGWTGGGKYGAFAHYAYHGYYALDFTSLDANMGTVDEFRTFVTEAHKRGMRVILDVVMNHSGYATIKDMCDYGYGVRSDGKSACEEWKPGSGENWHKKPISESKDSKWDNWWGSSWLIFGGYGDQCGEGDNLDACISYLPDFKNSNTHGTKVSVPGFLATKWATADSKHDVPAAKQYRSGSMSVAEFQAHWLASWVEEFGIDGFRCDTAKHVTQSTWKLLKEYSQEALKKWRSNTSVSADPAAAWEDDFWMTGEHWGYGTDANDVDSYASKGGFDSMINFSFNPKSGCTVPTTSHWESYADMYGVGSGSPKLNALSYLSSHDTSLCRTGDMKNVATMFELLPGGVQVYYGDETSRPNDKGGSGNDEEHGTRSDMNFPSDIDNASAWAANVDTLSTSFSSNATLAHWQKVGQFRFRNAAVGAGKQTKTADGSYCRIYNDEAKGINNSVVIHLGKASAVNVGNCFEDGTELQDGYSGATGIVSGGSVSLSGTGDVILLELKR